MKDQATILRRQSFLDEEVGFDYIVDQRDYNEFSEYIVSIGGDSRILRVYGDKRDEMKVYCR